MKNYIFILKTDEYSVKYGYKKYVILKTQTFPKNAMISGEFQFPKPLYNEFR